MQAAKADMGHLDLAEGDVIDVTTVRESRDACRRMILFITAEIPRVHRFILDI